MFLRTLKLKNYRKFRDETIEFFEGIIGIVGPNGVGKSTILEAIGWALYGNVMVRTEKYEVKSQNAGDNNDCAAELEFDMSGHSYKIIREIKGKNVTSNALVYIDGSNEPEAQRDSGVNEYVDKLFGMDYVAFVRTVYAKQKDLAALSMLRPEERKKVIRRMLNIDRIDSAITQIRADKRYKEEYKKGIEASLEDINKLRMKRKEILSEQKKIEESVKELTSIAKTVSEEKARIIKEKDIQDQKYKTFNDLNNQASRFSEQQSSLKDRLEEVLKDKEELEQKKKKLEKIASKEQEYTKTKTEKEEQETLRLKYQAKMRLEESISEKNEEIGTREENLEKIMENLRPFEEVEKEANRIEKNINSTEERRRELEKIAKDIQGEVSVLKSKVNELSSKKEDISMLGPDSKCPTCFRALGNNYQDIIKHLNNEIKTHKEKLRAVCQKKDKIDKEHSTILMKIDGLVEKKNQIIQRLRKKSELEQSLRGEQKELKKIKSKLDIEERKFKEFRDVKFDKESYEKLIEKFDELSKIRDTILGLRKEVQRIPKLVEVIESLRKEIAVSETALKSLSQKLTELDFDEERYEKVKNTHEKVSEKFTKVQVELETAKGQMGLSKQKFVDINKDIEHQIECREKIKETQVDLQYLQRLESLMEDFRLELTGRIRPLLELKASYLFNEVTDGRYPKMELDENYEISILDGNEAYRLRRFSGGEEDLANLCLRIAMSQVIAERSDAEINFIALDEIFGSQDEKRRQNILNSLHRLSSQFRQILLITHIEDIKEMFPRVLRIKENLSTKESCVILE